MDRRVANGFLLSLLSFFWLGAAAGQSGDGTRMEKLLDQVDRPGSWPAISPKTTAPGSVPAKPFLNQGTGTGSAAQTQNQFTPQNILRVLLGAPPKGTKSGSFSGAKGNVE